MKQIEQIIDRQRKFFATGATRDISGRIETLRRLRNAIDNHSGEITAALRQDLGKSEFESYMTEIGVVRSEIDYLCRHLRKWAKAKKVSTPVFLMPGRSRIIYEPLGVVLVIAPWNYPLQLALNPLAGAIAAGNCVVMKAAQTTPNVAKAMRNVIEEVFPPEYVTLVDNTPAMREELLDGVYDHIFFTGGTDFARTVMSKAAANLTPVTLELGGKSPCIVGSKANLDIAARRIMWGKLLNAGQTCVAPDYLLVHESVADELLEKMRSAAVRFYGEDPRASSNYPRIVTRKAAERLAGLIKTGGEVVFGGEYNVDTKYIAPTIIRNVPEGHELLHKEIFGPILPVVTYREAQEAVDFVNARPKPLAFYYFGSRKNANAILAATSSGGVAINDTIMHFANLHLPFGGVGHSGMGRYHGKESFLTFSNQRAVLRSSTLVDIPVRYAPFKGLKLLKKVL